MNQMLGNKLKSFTGGGEDEDDSKAGAEEKETPKACPGRSLRSVRSSWWKKSE